MTRLVPIFDSPISVLLFAKDYLLQGRDRYFIYSKGVIKEVSTIELVLWPTPLVTHDYGMIARAICASANALPTRVIDLVEIHRSTLGERLSSKSSRDAMFGLLANAGMSAGALASYSDIFFGRSAPDVLVYQEAAGWMLAVWEALSLRARVLNEIERLESVEIPVFNVLWAHAVKGILIDTDVLRRHKTTVSTEYFSELKSFALKHKVPFEVPSEVAIKARLDEMGLDTEDTSLDYLLTFVQMPNNYGSDLLSLKKIARSKSLLEDLSVQKKRTYPGITISGTVTSRIIMHGPSLQNLARRHRDIIRADPGKALGYVDFAQFEIGIMVALSGDPLMREMYETGDLYTGVADRIFGDRGRRKIAKRLFLSYSYGMAQASLIDAAVEQGASRANAREFFKSFFTFESWKNQVREDYQRSSMTCSLLGNNLIRRRRGDLTEKEKRSCVSQVIQGTASLIFKRSLIALSRIEGLDILIPMHDAVLYQSSQEDASSQVKLAFEAAFATHFEGRATAIAEVAQFH